MSQIAFLVDNPDIVVADSPNFIGVGNELVRLVKMQMPRPDNIAFHSIVIANGTGMVVNPTINLLTVAGGAAGDITVTGVTAASVLKKVEAVKDADQTLLHLVGEFTSASGKINNTGGTNTTGYHLVVVWE
jgi:hypothetical protein